LGHAQQECLVKGIIVIISRFLKRLVGGDNAIGSNAASLRNVIVWVFIALVALFLTHPSGGPFSASDTPVPWPAELGLDNSLLGGGPAK
jgi:hypothetical protein